jgi:hypothetical protein
MAAEARVAPFHFSPRYIGREDELRREVEAAWRAGQSRGRPPERQPD